MVNSRTFEHLPISKLMATVRQDLRKLDDEGLIDEGRLIKTIMWCNEKLGIPIRELKECAIAVESHKAPLPLDFDKLHFVCGLNDKKTVTHNQTNPFDNNVDTDVVYEAKLDRGNFGGTEKYHVTVKRLTNITIHTQENWVSLDVDKSAHTYCHSNCPNIQNRNKGKVYIKDDVIHTPFEKGMIYIMYLGNMRDEEGNLLFPFHPMITPWYEWCLKEKILMDAVFNSDGNYAELLKLAKQEKNLSWLDAFNITTEKSYGEYVRMQKEKEQKYFNKYYKYWK